MFKKLSFIFLTVFIFSLLISCAGTQVVSGELVSNSVERNYESLSHEDAMSLVEEYDTAEPTLKITPNDENSFTVNASLGERSWLRNYVVVKPDKPEELSVFDKIKTFILWVVVLGAVVVAGIFIYRRKEWLQAMTKRMKL